MKVKISGRFFTALMAVVLLVGMLPPLPAYAAPPVADAAGLTAALAAAVDGDTITLGADITYNQGITINGKSITLDVAGHTLNVSNPSGVGLSVTGSASALLLADSVGGGALNVTGTTCGIQATNGSTAQATTAKATGQNSYAISTDTGATVNVTGDVTATGIATTNNGAGGINANGSSTVTVGGNVTATGTLSTGIWVNNHSKVTVQGDATGVAYGVNANGVAVGPADVIVQVNNAIATGMGPGGNAGIGAYVTSYAVLTVKGNATAIGVGAYADKSGAILTVEGDAVSTGAGGIGALAANTATTIVQGDVLAQGLDSIGAVAAVGGTVTIDGTISSTANYYVGVGSSGNVPKSEGENIATTTKEGYLTYTDTGDMYKSTVWVKAPTIAITIDPTTATVEAGDTQQFTSTVTGTTNHDVTWTVSGNTSTGTHIDTDGTLHVGEDETATTLTVRVTSDADTSKWAEATVTVTQKTPPQHSVISVTVTPSPVTLDPGATRQFTADVTGTGNYDPSVTWSVSGNTSSGTFIDPVTGVLTIGADEKATTLIVRATSNEDSTKFGESVVTVRQGSKEETTTPGGGSALTPGTTLTLPPTGDDGNLTVVLFGGSIAFVVLVGCSVATRKRKYKA